MLAGDQEGTREAIHRRFESNLRVLGRVDDAMREFVCQVEALALDVGPGGDHDGIGDRLPTAQNAAGEAVDALRQVVLDDLDPIVLKEGAHARDRVGPELPEVSQLVGLGVDLVLRRDAVGGKFVEPIDLGRDAEDVLDCQVAFKVVDDDRFRECAVARGSRGVLAELQAVERLDLGAHQEVEGYLEGLGEPDEDGGGRHHPAGFVLADGLGGYRGGDLGRKGLHGKAHAFAS